MIPNLIRGPTDLPGADAQLDRSIYSDGVPITRAFQFNVGQNAGRWQWAGHWSPAEFGIVETLDDALAEIKATVTEEKLRTLPPGPYAKQSIAGE